MTAHELARKLLDGPDVLVLTLADEEKGLYRPIKEPDIWHAWPERGAVDPLWYIMGDMERVRPPSGSIKAIVLFPA